MVIVKKFSYPLSDCVIINQAVRPRMERELIGLVNQIAFILTYFKESEQDIAHTYRSIKYKSCNNYNIPVHEWDELLLRHAQAMRFRI